MPIYELTCLSPVHVGTGTDFTQFDGAYRDGRWYRIDLDRLLAEGRDVRQLGQQMSMRSFAWGDWLRTRGRHPADVSAYALPCPSDPGETPVREFIKDVYGRPYLPGSSIKGALRTAVLWQLMKEDPTLGREAAGYLTSDQASRKPEWLGQPIEQNVLGKTNYDLLRAVKVGDAAAVDIDRLAIGLTWTYTLRGDQLVEKKDRDGEYKVFVEWLVPETKFRFVVQIDDFLFTERAERELHLCGSKETAIRQLDRTCNTLAHKLIQAERAFFAAYGPEELWHYYTRLESLVQALPDGIFLVNIGWGGGWEVKTVGEVLRASLGEHQFQALRSRYHLGENPKTGRLLQDAPFPKTRHIAYGDGEPRWPLGWVLVSPQGAEVPALPARSVSAAPARTRPLAGGPQVSAKPINQGQTRQGTLRRKGDRWLALFAGDNREAQIVNPEKIPKDLQDAQTAEFYIVVASKREGIWARFDRIK